MAKTKFFHSCLGVFQGGGCRAAALVGAYDEAVKYGVQFVEVAGTSAGSIIAVLIGAGATPEQLNAFINELDFGKFLKPPEVIQPPGFFTRLITKPLGRYADFGLHQGMYSSIEIEKWVESCLRRLLGEHQGPIPFSKLSYPTSVVATDILSRRARVWNQTLSPGESVAKAVRASCSIPFFFQPVDRQYVDGGILSNLPTFVFENSAAGRPLTSRILAFTLRGDDEIIENWGTFPYMSAVANTIVDGAQELQIALQSDVHSIVIPTGKIKATDFDKIDAPSIALLLQAGRNATADFFRSELANVKAPRFPSAVCFDREDLYNRVTTHLNERVADVLIAEFDTEFVYKLFPTLLLWRLRGVRIRIAVPKTETKSDGPYRRRLLIKLGVQLIEVNSLPFRGYFINGHNACNGSAYVAIPSLKRTEAIIYEGTIHEFAITALYNQVSALFPETASVATRPTMTADSLANLISKLKTVPQYSRPDVHLTIESVPLSDCLALASYVHEYKYRQIEHWIPEFKRRDIGLFESAAVQLLGSATSIITPPVVEVAGNKYVLVEGTTRATVLRDQGEDRMLCVVARGIEDPLPGTTCPFSSVRVVGRRADTDFRYKDFNYMLFRKIELAAHPLNSFL